MSTTTPVKPTTTSTLTDRRARYVRNYRAAAEQHTAAINMRDSAIVNYFRSLPDSVTTVTLSGRERT